MSALIKANTDYKPGLITELDDNDGERKFDALAADVINQGSVIFLDYNNATAGLRAWKLVGTTGAELGPYAVATKAKANGDIKITGVKEGKVTVTADGAIAGGAYLKPGTTTAGAVAQWLATDNVNLRIGRYIKLAKYANSNDGNNALAAASAGDVIVMEFLE